VQKWTFVPMPNLATTLSVAKGAASSLIIELELCMSLSPNAPMAGFALLAWTTRKKNAPYYGAVSNSS